MISEYRCSGWKMSKAVQLTSGGSDAALEDDAVDRRRRAEAVCSFPRVAKSSAALAQSGRLSRSIGRAFTGRAMDRHRRRARESYSGTGSGAAAHLSIVASDPSTREIAPHWAVRKTLAPARCQASIVAGAGCPNVCKRASRRRGVCAPRPIDARARARGSQARTRSADCEGAPG